MKIYIIKTTYPTLESALLLKDSLLQNKLASCIHIQQITSFYHWGGNICEDKEFELSIKTSKQFYQTIESIIISTHPYEIPQIVAFSAKKALKSYQKWHIKSLKQ